MRTTRQMRFQIHTGLLLGAMLIMSHVSGRAADVAQDSLMAKAEWLAQNLLYLQKDKPAEAGLTILANHDAVIKNGRGGEPLRIADKEFKRGLYCHAVSKVLVTLPSPGKSFSAIVGVDNNADTRAGKSSVVFSVTANEKVLFKSEVLRINSPGVPVEVDLGGATSFLMDVGDAGDGIGWDQSNWAEAKVVLADGKELWVGDLPIVAAASAALPFTFKYDGADSAAFLASWALKTDVKELDADKTQRTFIWTDPKTGLEVRCAAVEYENFPTVEWTLYFKNTGKADTPIIANIQALNMLLPRATRDSGAPLLRRWLLRAAGLQAAGDALVSRENGRIDLRRAVAVRDRSMPYFNLECGRRGRDHGGRLAGTVGGRVLRGRGTTGMRVRAGQELTHFMLHPGRRSPHAADRAAVLEGRRLDRAQNVWRRWMLAHNMPRPGRQAAAAPDGRRAARISFNEMLNANEENQIHVHRPRHASEGLKLDYWWMDAGWYPNDGGWWKTGTWEVDSKRFPHGLRAISDVRSREGHQDHRLVRAGARRRPDTWL